MAIAPETAAPPPGLTTTKAPFIEEARAHGDIYIHQPYELYSAENQATWAAAARADAGPLAALREPALPGGLDKLSFAGAHPAARGGQPLPQPLTGFSARAGQRLRPVLRLLRLPAPPRVSDHRSPSATARSLDYLPEPDIFHDVAGHVPMHTDPAFAAGAGPLRRLRRGGGAPRGGDHATSTRSCAA